MTVSGREPSVTSGLVGAGAGCAVADDTRAARARAAHQVAARPRTCFDIGTILPHKICAQHSTAVPGYHGAADRRGDRLLGPDRGRERAWRPARGLTGMRGGEKEHARGAAATR